LLGITQNTQLAPAALKKVDNAGSSKRLSQQAHTCPPEPPNRTQGALFDFALRAQSSHARAPMAPPASDALSILQNAISAIETHFAKADALGKPIDLLGNDQKNKEIAVLVRGQLCTALSRVLLHGFKSFKLIGRYHIWDFVQQSRDATYERSRKNPHQLHTAQSPDLPPLERAIHLAQVVSSLTRLNAP